MPVSRTSLANCVPSSCASADARRANLECRNPWPASSARRRLFSCSAACSRTSAPRPRASGDFAPKHAIPSYSYLRSHLPPPRFPYDRA